MVTYIYFVKCPNCEDEPFDFFDEAKGYAMGCLSQKPVITQTEVCRNDFGECTDSADLGQIWSWEDECTTDAEPAKAIFTKDDLKDYVPDEDPEFASIDNSVDFEPEIPETPEVSALDDQPDNFRKPITEAKADPFHEAIFEAIDYLVEFSDIFPVPGNIGTSDWKELKDDIRYGLSSDFEIAEIIMEYLDKDLAMGRKHPEIFEDDPQSELTLETYNRLKRAYDRAVADYEAAHPEDFEESCCKEAMSKVQAAYLSRRKPMTKEEFAERLEVEDEILIFTGDPRELGIRGRDYFAAKVDGKYEVSFWDETYEDEFTDSEVVETFDTIDELWAYMVDFMEDDDFNPEYNYLAEACARKPVPEGMTIDQLKEAMEENEDTVECAGCEELFPKEDCFHKDGIGWLCDRCEMGIKSRGETLTFREGSYWDYLDEEVEPDEIHDLGNTYDGGYPENTLVEALGYDCPKLKEADNNQPGIAKFKILFQFRKDPTVQGSYGDCPYLSGLGLNTTFKNVRLIDSTRRSYGTIKDIELADNGEVMLTTHEGKSYSLRQALKISNKSTEKFSNTYTVLLAIKKAAEAAEKSLNTKQVRNLRVRNALAQLNKKVANEFKAAITNIVFRIPAHNAYSADDILDIDPDASEAIAEKAAEKINKIHDDFYGLSFVRANKDQMESSGMIEDRVPAEKAAWINSSWGAVGKVYFDRPINKLSVDAQKIIANAKLSDAKVDPKVDSVDCYRLATELIRFFGNDPWFYTKPVESDNDDVETEESEAVDEAFNLDFPEI